MKICIGHITNTCPGCTQDVHNVNCEGYRSVEVFMLEVQEKEVKFELLLSEAQKESEKKKSDRPLS